MTGLVNIKFRSECIKNTGIVLIIADSATSGIEAIFCFCRCSESIKKSVWFNFFWMMMISEKGPEYIQLNNWFSQPGCRKMESLTFSPEFSEAAESAVQTIKSVLKVYV